MGQPSHPNGSRVNSVQVADNSVSWHGNDRAFFFQSYLLSILFKFIRHWLNTSLVVPYKTPWYDGRKNRLARLRSRRARPVDDNIIPNLEWKNNLPRALGGVSNEKARGRLFNRIVFRYFRKLPSRLFLRDGLGDLLRPSVILKRPRRSFTFWNRPRLLRCTKVVFCLLKGVGAGEKPHKPSLPKRWLRRVSRKGAWKRTPLVADNFNMLPSVKHWRAEL